MRPTQCLAVACFVVLAACGGSGASNCPNTLPACPATPPSYQADIIPIMKSNCGPCHQPGGSEYQSHAFDSYATIYQQRSAILDQVHACLMPPYNGTPLDDQAKTTLLTWLVCNAPNN